MAVKDAAGSEAHGSGRCSCKRVSWQHRMQLEVSLMTAIDAAAVRESHGSKGCSWK